MSFEVLNYQLFSYLNAPTTASQTDIKFAIFIANDTLYILLLFIMMIWFLGSHQSKALALKAIITTAVALIIGYIISLGYPHPRPFVLHLGNTLIPHSPTASFPSNHMLIFSSIALSYIFAKQYKLGMTLLVFAFFVAWARIYVGVHFPMDMLGALCIGLFTSAIIQWIWNRHHKQIMGVAIKLYHYIFHTFIKKGWIR